MTVNSRSIGAPLVVGLACLLTGARLDDATWTDHDQRGWDSQKRGDYAAAEAHFRAAIEAARAFGEHDSRLGHSATDLAWTLYYQGRYSEAEPFATQGLKIREAAQGERPELAEALDAVAVIQHARGRYAESEAARKRSIAIFEQTRGKNDPDVASSLNSLAALYITLGRFSEAEPVLRRAVSIWEKASARIVATWPSVSRACRSLSRGSDDSRKRSRWHGEPSRFGKKSSVAITPMWR